MAVHAQRLKMINEEVAARSKAGLDFSKLIAMQGREEAALTKTLQKEAVARYKNYSQYTTSLGQAMGDVLSGQKTMMEAFGNSIVDIFFDIISKIIETKIMEATAVAVAEQAKAAAISAAQPDSVATFGATAVARTAAIGAIIMGALAAAKATLKGMIGKKKTSSSSESKASSRKERVVSGFADGGYHEGYTGDGNKYDVKGRFPDGQPYHAGEYIIPREVLRMPSIAPIVRQIEATRKQHSSRNPLPEGFAEGGYHNESYPRNLFGLDQSVLQELISVLGDLRDKKFDINYRDFGKVAKTMDNYQKFGSK